MSTPSFTLRPATRADLPAIVGLIRELAVYEKLEYLVVCTPESIAPHLFGPRPAAEVVVAEVPAEVALEVSAEMPAEVPAADTPVVVGFALYFTNFSTFLGRPGLYLEDLYVKPAQRGRGIGKALLAHLGALAVERGCGRFEWSVLDWNEPAIRFYERMGATLLPDWRICRVTGGALAAFERRAA